MNTFATLLLINVVGVVAFDIGLRIDKRRSQDESLRQRCARWFFHCFVSLEVMALLVGLFLFLLAVVFYKMPLDWEKMHGFCKRGAPLVNPATFSLLIAFFGVIPGLISCVLSPKLWRICTLLLIVFLGYEFQSIFVHWLVD